ncbi:hypothetical protein ANCDUO_18399 [Ancylostoma duodenale]|uniref:Uncharacterized protein n=1 Tax=Ancylostoma duodenale TaxID=51022 RepID=A0A0C2FXZ1_9BILA|nr:hypothetical protein ANCDUO_18399 [Ancylostoma duodenale]
MIIAVGANLIYGATVGDAIIPSVQLQWVQQAIGASTMSIMTMIMPSIFFLFLNASQIKREKLLKDGKITEGEHEDRATISE